MSKNVLVLTGFLLGLALLGADAGGGAERLPARRGGDPAHPAKEAGGTRVEEDGAVPRPPESEKVRLTGVRHLSSPTYSRVIIDLTHPARYEVRQLKQDTAKGLPPRIYVDVFDARLLADGKEPLVVEDGLLRSIRFGQFTPDVVRVVLDMKDLRAHEAFLLADPYRLIIDIQGEKAVNGAAALAKTKAPGARGQVKPPVPAGGIRKVVLDPGHGGKDPGAIGVGGMTEKDIVLAVAKKLARKLAKEMGVEVVLTRKDDSFVPLEDRTAIANAENADLFISLHTNASPKPDARGVETYYLDNTNDEGSIRLAARENGTSRKNISDLQFILSDMTQNMKLEDSISLAHRLQGSLVNGLSGKLDEVRDLGVKKALFYVLVGARMPSVLVELFFITNKAEAGAMRHEKYQEALAEALFDGIQKYSQSVLAMKTL